MKNETSVTYFYLLPFSGDTINKPLFSALFFFIYLVGVLINSSIITVICLDLQLHKPMYLFICNLSIVDIFYTSVTVPKLLYMLLSGDHIVSFSQCYMQFYFLVVVAGAEEILLFVMAYDRYVAICIPLHYCLILSRRNCTLLTCGIWAAAFLNSLLYIVTAVYTSSCHSNIIHQFFCDAKSLTKTTCTTVRMFILIDAMEIFLFAIVPLLGTFFSYLNIFLIIFKMKSQESKRKALSTCSSHITIIAIYYGTGLIGYLIPPYSDILDLVFDAIFTTIVPMINPIIYSLQNYNIKAAFQGLLSKIYSCYKH